MDWFAEYMSYCQTNNHRTVPSSAFFKLMKPHVEVKKSNGKNYKVATLDSLKESLKAYL
jgi:hypothetical protein